MVKNIYTDYEFNGGKISGIADGVNASMHKTPPCVPILMPRF